MNTKDTSRIYVIYYDDILEVPVVKETPRTYKLDRHKTVSILRQENTPYFFYDSLRKQGHKKIFLTAKEAYEEMVRIKIEAISKAEAKLNKAKEEFVAALAYAELFEE